MNYQIFSIVIMSITYEIFVLNCWFNTILVVYDVSYCDIGLSRSLMIYSGFK